jgi:hypothetical protein
MESSVWTAVGDLSETPEFDGDVSETIERLCTEALEARGLIGGE